MATSLVQTLTDIKTKLNDLIVDIDVLLGASLLVDDSASTNATGTPPQKKRRTKKAKPAEVVDESVSVPVEVVESSTKPTKKKRTPKANPVTVDEEVKEVTKPSKKRGRKTAESKVLDL